MTTKEQYIKFSECSADLPVFLHPWWLDVVSENIDWDVSLVIDKEQKIMGALPFIKEKKFFFNLSRMPPLTPFLGPWIRPYKGKKSHRLYSYENRILTSLISQLPLFYFFSQKFSPSISNWYPFFKQGFNQTTSYTYILNNIKNHDVIWYNMKNTVRTIIRNAEFNIRITDSSDIKVMFNLVKKTFTRQSLQVPYSEEYLSNIFLECTKRQKGKLFLAVDINNKIHAGLLLVWDNNVAYNLVLGVDENYRKYGAVQVLIWNAIKFASTIVEKFNFEGSMLSHIEPVFRHFGGIRTPYFILSKDRNKIIRTLRIILDK